MIVPNLSSFCLLVNVALFVHLGLLFEVVVHFLLSIGERVSLEKIENTMNESCKRRAELRRKTPILGISLLILLFVLHLADYCDFFILCLADHCDGRR